ncbi:MAG TPA: SRPBCC domain-containing protein [Candidatus Thermoplasmatota archaeon]|nr:SRPBCC domain-containing protein [Candidatus Thermoplasmatota archaeon]
MTPKMLPDRTIALRHAFRSPAAKVFAAYTDPKQVPQWWGFPKGSLQVDRMDVRPGGGFRFLQRMPDGTTMASVGSYLEVKPVTRLVYTFQVEGQPGAPVTTTVELAEMAGATTLTLTIEFPSKEACDAAVQYGAVGGAKAAMETLARFLEA